MSECRDGARDVSTVRASSRSARVDAARREAYNKSACHNYKSFLFLRTNHPSLARRRITHPSFVSNPLETHPRSLFGRKGEIPKPLRRRFRRPLRAVSRIRDHILARRRVRALDGRTIFSRHHRVVKRLTIRTHVRVEELALALLAHDVLILGRPSTRVPGVVEHSVRRTRGVVGQTLILTNFIVAVFERRRRRARDASRGRFRSRRHRRRGAKNVAIVHVARGERGDG